MSVSESASSALTLEAISTICRESFKRSQEPDVETPYALIVSRALEDQGALIGVRLAERLLYKEPSFSGMPQDIARFVGTSVWRAMFGKKIDSITVSDNTYYLRDGNFRWLEGFPKLQNVDRIQCSSLDSCLPSQRGQELGGEVSDAQVTHDDLLLYTIGIIKGAAHNLVVDDDTIAISATLSKEGETVFVLSFGQRCD